MADPVVSRRRSVETGRCADLESASRALRGDYQHVTSDSADESEQAAARRCRIQSKAEEGFDCSSGQWRSDPSKRRRSGDNQTTVRHMYWDSGLRVTLDPETSSNPKVHLRDKWRRRRRGPASTCMLGGYRPTGTPMHDAFCSSPESMASPFQLSVYCPSVFPYYHISAFSSPPFQTCSPSILTL